MATKRKFGSIEQLPSGKWRARYSGPDGSAHKLPTTFLDYDDAAAWLKGERKFITIFTLFHGLRIGEALGLRRWQN